MTIERPTYLWSTCCAWGLTIAVVVWGAAGASATFLPGTELAGLSAPQWCAVAFAATFVFAVACANNCAAAAMHAISQPEWHWATLLPAALCAVCFAAASNVAVHLGWSTLAAQAADPAALPAASDVNTAALFLCFAKPAMAWIIEGRKAMDGQRAAAEALAEEERLAAIREAERLTRPAERPAAPSFQPAVIEGGRSANHVGQALAGVAAISTGAVGAVADRPTEAISLDLPRLDALSHSEQTWPSPECHAVALLKAGKSQRAVVRETGLTRYRVGRIRAMEAA